MQIRPDRGWIKAGLAVLVTGVLGGGVLAAAGGSRPAQKLTADGVTEQGAEPAPSGDGFDLGAVRPAGADEAPADKADPVVGDKVPMGDGSVTVSAVEDNVSAGRLFGAGKGFKYIAAEVKGCSGPNEKNITFEPAYFLLVLDDGTIRDPGVDAKKPSLDGGKVPPGKCLSGWVTFTVPEGALPTGVIYDGSVRTTWTVPLPKNAKQTTTTTMKPGAATPTTAEEGGEDGPDGSDGSTTPSTKPSSTSTTSKSTATTSKSTATTSKPTPTTARGSTATTGRSTATTGKSSSGSTTTTAKSSSSSSTTTTGKSSGSTTTTGKPSGSTPTTSKGTTSSTAAGNGQVNGNG